MPSKRGREVFEEEMQAQQSPYVFFGTALPPLDPSVRDDGSYVPVWKQTVTDERGRRRLHGAFTGGFSAGYFNTVGSKEGWTPSNFISSRDKKNNAAPTTQRPEDFMDEEDLADAAEAEHIHTSKSFSTIGSSHADQSKLSLARSSEDTVGMRLLQKMGWRQGQGIGPKVKRKADLGKDDDYEDDAEAHLFAPRNSPLISLVKKGDSKGLGYGGSSNKPAKDSSLSDRWFGLRDEREAENDDDLKELGRDLIKPGVKKSGFGVGILNDTGSDDEDPYSMGPRISLSSVVVPKAKSKKNGIKKSTTISNPRIPSRPLLVTKKPPEHKQSRPQKCHDGMAPLRGFVLVSASARTNMAQFLLPTIPKDWSSARKGPSGGLQQQIPSVPSGAATENPGHQSLDPTSRAKILGEAPLKGKSVFDFMSTEARNRLVSATGKVDLPPGRGEQGPLPATAVDGGAEQLSDLLQLPPDDVVKAALVRIATGWTPYVDDKEKALRYRKFLETCSNSRDAKVDRPNRLSRSDWIKELEEFTHAARVFKPVTGMMASRFTAASTSSSAGSSSRDLLSQPTKAADSSPQAAARANMFGPLTRSLHSFFPSRLLCKRFGVPPPNVDAAPRYHQSTTRHAVVPDKPVEIPATGTESIKVSESTATTGANHGHGQTNSFAVDAQSNSALEGPRAGDSIFDAIFNS